MKTGTKIPFFQEFGPLHAAFGLYYKEVFKDINLFRYEDAGSCTMDIAPYRNDFYQIFFIHHTNLTGNYNDNHLHFTSKNHYLLFTCPGKLISWKRSSDLHGYIFSFKPSFFLSFMSNPAFLRKFHFFNPEANTPLLLKSKKEIALIGSLFRSIAEEYKHKQPDSLDIISSYIYILLTHANRLFLTTSASRAAIPAQKRNIRKEFEALVRKHLSAHRSVSEYASLLHVTPKHLSETLRKDSGRTAREIIQEILMLEAKSLLLQTELSISEIGHRLGFTDASHFTKLFKSKVGKTPSAFLKKR